MSLQQSNSNKKPKQRVQNISCVLPQTNQLGALYVGNIYGAQNVPILKQYGIRSVLTLSTQAQVQYPQKDIPYHLVIHAHDKDDYQLIHHIQQCIRYIQEKRKLTNVYIHCFAGVSRSVTICIAYLMRKFKWSLEIALKFMICKRIVSKPNDGFLMQLKVFQSEQGISQNNNQNNQNKAQSNQESSQFLKSTKYVNDLARQNIHRVQNIHQIPNIHNIANSPSRITYVKQYKQNNMNHDYYDNNISIANNRDFIERQKSKEASRLKYGLNLIPNNSISGCQLNSNQTFKLPAKEQFQTGSLASNNNKRYYITNNVNEFQSQNSNGFKNQRSYPKRNSIHNSFNGGSVDIQPIHYLSPLKNRKQESQNKIIGINRSSSNVNVIYEPKILNKSKTKLNKNILSNQNFYILTGQTQRKRETIPSISSTTFQSSSFKYNPLQSFNSSGGILNGINTNNSSLRNTTLDFTSYNPTPTSKYSNNISYNFHPSHNQDYFLNNPNNQINQSIYLNRASEPLISNNYMGVSNGFASGNGFRPQITNLNQTSSSNYSTSQRKNQVQISSNSRIAYKHDSIPIPKLTNRTKRTNQKQQQQQLTSMNNKRNISNFNEEKKNKSRVVRPKDLPGYNKY